jgi:hypothetical protein
LKLSEDFSHFLATFLLHQPKTSHYFRDLLGVEKCDVIHGVQEKLLAVVPTGQENNHYKIEIFLPLLVAPVALLTGCRLGTDSSLIIPETKASRYQPTFFTTQNFLELQDASVSWRLR